MIEQPKYSELLAMSSSISTEHGSSYYSWLIFLANRILRGYSGACASFAGRAVDRLHKEVTPAKEAVLEQAGIHVVIPPIAEYTCGILVEQWHNVMMERAKPKYIPHVRPKARRVLRVFVCKGFTPSRLQGSRVGFEQEDVSGPVPWVCFSCTRNF